MNVRQPITIAGGGLAGLSLGIALRNRGIPVTVLEAGRYPRHRVCGEFLSGFGQDILSDLGVLPACLEAGARWAESVRFATPTTVGLPRRLPRPALCLSRYRMDALLAAEFQRRGGELHIGERAPENAGREGWVRATGRRIAPGGSRWRWFGVKAHARGVRLDADLELHLTPGAYVGLCQIDAENVNICGLFRRRSGEESTPVHSPLDWLRGPEGSPWRERVRSAVFQPETLCTTGGLDLRVSPSIPADTILLGDARAIIPPLTGNGMSLALESAHRAVGPLAAYSEETASWSQTCTTIHQAHQRSFRSRLRWAGVLQRLLFLPVVPSLAFRLMHQSESAWRLLFAVTRA